MSAEPQLPPLDNTPRITQQFGQTGVPGFPDTFAGPRDKRYLDFIARQTTRLRGTNAYYYVLRSQTQRMDGNAPTTDAPGLGPFDRRGRAGGHVVEEALGVAALYGEPLVIGTRLDSQQRHVTQTWDYAEPVLVRGLCLHLQRSERADARGTIYIRKLQFDLARVLCNQEWDIVPQPGDVVRLPNLLGSYDPKQPDEAYYDVEAVETNASKFGATGFFTVYSLTLDHQTKYDPQRKFPEQLKRAQPEPPV